MSKIFRRHLSVAGRHELVLARRQWLRAFSASAGLSVGLSWTDTLSLRAEDLRRQGKACILLWMPGGPSQFETFDPKPDHANGGGTKAIATKVPGIEIAENLPRLALVADRLAIIRSMTTREGDHARASHLMHTASLPTGGVQYPALGAVAAHEIAQAACELPAYVRIGGGVNGGAGGGYLGTQYDAYAVPSSSRPPENTRLASDRQRFEGRVDLMRRLQTASQRPASKGHEHLEMYAQASRMILSPQMEAFDLESEAAGARELYGWSAALGPVAGGRRDMAGPEATAQRRSQFAADCLLARRLVEAGVTLVEVSVRGWDTHNDNFNQCRSLCDALDQPFAALVTDLDQRGLLDKTLLVWMGEFGRTPRINSVNAGRDHFPRAFSAVLAGGGIRGGRVLGATDAGGETIKDRPVTEKDLFQTIYKSLGIDALKQNMTPIGRPIKFVDGGAPVTELFY